MNKHHTTRSRWLLAVVPLIVALIATTVFAYPETVFDLTAPGSSAPVNGAFMYKYATGTGDFNPFLAIQANGIERGFNTDGTLQFDTLGAGTHSLLLTAIPEVLYGGVRYREFALDLNELPGGDIEKLSLGEIQIFQADVGNLTGYSASPPPPSIGGGTTLIWNLDSQQDNGMILSGTSGTPDYILLVPSSLFNTQPYVYLYSTMGCLSPYWADDGPEEWGVCSENGVAVPCTPQTHLSTVPNPTIAKAGVTLKDTATLGGLNGSGPFGSLMFDLYDNVGCNGLPVYSETVPAVNGNNNYTTPIGYLVPASAPSGTWQWVVSYGGDAINPSASGECGDEPVIVDMQAPSCALTGVHAGPPKSIDVTVQDSLSGLANVQVTRAINLSVAWLPAWMPGDTFAVIYTATKIDQSLGSQFALKVTDVAGNVTLCDPVDLTVSRDTGKPTTAEFSDIPQAESKITISNGTPGLTNLSITVNGEKFQVAGLKAGEVQELDVALAMVAGDNTISFTGLGKSGDSASVLIHD